MIIHIDISEKFENKKTIGIAWITEDKKSHKGTALSGKIIKELIKKQNININYPKLYSILVFLILHKNIENVKKIVICNDYNFDKIDCYLRLLFLNYANYAKIEVMSIREYRSKLGFYFESYADGVAKSYRKRGLKPKRRETGKKLNYIEVKYQEIINLWNKL
jgi:hypothetical protein